MKKNDVYFDILQGALLQIRSVSSHGVFVKARDKSIYYESQLIHDFYQLLRTEDFNGGDIWFLNVHARWYYENCDKKKSFLYDHQLKRISTLFSLVPEKMKEQLQWEGPVIK
ncbi:MAG TPA: hypothetical protein DIW62_02745 [Raoultella sp.]|nr:hypothetical protein [Raoultella sp.]